MSRVFVHLVRHGRVASHQGDIPLTSQGYDETRAAGQRLGEEVSGRERIHFLYTPTVRSRETAAALHETVSRGTAAGVEILAPREEWSIRNPDQFVAGHRVEMVSSADAMADQIPSDEVTAEVVDAAEYYHDFFRSADRIGYWINHPDPPGENTDAVGRRIASYCRSLLDRPSERVERYVCVTHSPVMRALIVRTMDYDPGEPEWVERIDLSLDPDESTVTFRGATAPLGHGVSSRN